jgi:hypothetical protein
LLTAGGNCGLAAVAAGAAAAGADAVTGKATAFVPAAPAGAAGVVPGAAAVPVVDTASCCCWWAMNSSYPGAPGRGGTSFGRPPAQVGQASATAPLNELHPASTRQTPSAAVSANNGLVRPVVKSQPRYLGDGSGLARPLPFYFTPSGSVILEWARSSTTMFLNRCGRNRAAPSWRDCVGMWPANARYDGFYPFGIKDLLMGRFIASDVLSA